MYGMMAGETTAADYPGLEASGSCCRSLAVDLPAKAPGPVIRKSWMVTCIMTILTQTLYPFHQQACMAASMRRVTDHAVFFHWWMLPDKGAAFVGMALVTEQVVALGIDHVGGEGAMGVVAIGTFNLAFDNGMMRYLVGIGTDIFVAAEADFRLFDCGAGLMDIMAGDTGDIILLVRPHVPHGQIGRFVMAAKALVVELFGGMSTVFTEGNDRVLGLTVKMLISGTVAGLTVIFTLPDLGVEGRIKACHCLLMTLNAGCPFFRSQGYRR